MTSRLILSLTLTQNARGGGVGEGVGGVVWRWSSKSARCTVDMVGEECEFGGNVDCSVECDMECTMVTSGGEI